MQDVPRRMPLTIRIPLLMSAILVVVMGVALIVTYTTLRDSSLDRARQRLLRASRQFAATAVGGLTELRERYVVAAGDSLVRRALLGENVDVEPVLRRVARQGGDTAPRLPVELWSAAGRRIAFIGPDADTSLERRPGSRSLPERIVQAVGTGETTGGGDSLHVTPLFSVGDDTYFWCVMPVRAEGRILGYLTHQRRITPTQRATAVLRDLSGDSVSVYYRNADGSLWTLRSGAPMSPLRHTDSLSATAVGPAGERLLFNEERIGSTPWVLGLTVPVHTVLARNEPMLARMIWLSALLLAGGVLAAWLIGRRVARPLAQFTQAAEALARGDYTARVPTHGDPEVSRLGASLNHMAAEIGASRQALEQQTREARAANNAKSDFLTTMSHELRTPLNAIGGYVDLLEMELRGPLTAEQKRDLERIKASQQHLLGLISGVLDLARVEARKVAYDIVTVPLDAFLAGMDALIEPQAAAKKVTLDYVPCAPAVSVLADREKLRQILLNLLSNAIRHTPAGGRITLSAEPFASRVQIVVQDTGPGIPREKLDEIFEPFVQLDRSLTRPRDGLGLGLAISRDLARGMSGDLVVDAGCTHGARFVLTLPRGSADGATTYTMSGEMPAMHG